MTVNVASSNTAEGTVSPATLTFTSNNWNTAQTVTVTGVDDTNEDGHQGYGISLSAPNQPGVSDNPVVTTLAGSGTEGALLDGTGNISNI